MLPFTTAYGSSDKLLRHNLPSLETVEDCLLEDDIAFLLQKFLKCEVFVTQKPLTAISLDICDNWYHFALKTDRHHINSKIARKGVRLGIIERMILQAENEDFQLLNTIKNGGEIGENSFVRSVSGHIYSDRLDAKNKDHI